MRRTGLIIAWLCWMAPAWGQDLVGPAPTGEAAPAGVEWTPERIAGALRVDRETRTIEIDAEVVQRDVALELLLTSLVNGKPHEAILATPVSGAQLHAALLLMGLAPGRPVHWESLPTGEPVLVPPAGAEVHVAFRYDDEGATRSAAAHEWLLTAEGEPVDPVRWVFVGSDVLEEGGYWADLQGEIVSVSNFPSAVLDVPFQSTTENAALVFRANPAAVPALGTLVTLVIDVPADQQTAAVARATFDIDRFGRYALEGRPVEPEQIVEWARQFKQRHARPYIVARTAPRAMVYDVERLRGLLDEARIEDMDVQMRRVEGEVLPRTPEQMEAALAWWAERFAHAEDYIREPGEQADVVLRQIEYRRRELQAMLELWSHYQTRLRTALGEYHAATQPAGTSP